MTPQQEIDVGQVTDEVVATALEDIRFANRLGATFTFTNARRAEWVPSLRTRLESMGFRTTFDPSWNPLVICVFWTPPA